MELNVIKTRLILEILRRDNYITPSILDDGYAALESGIEPLELFVKDGIITKRDLQHALVEYANTPYVDLDTIDLSVDVLKIFGVDILDAYRFVPIYQFKNGLVLIGAVDPTNPMLLQVLRATLGNHYQILKVATDKLDNYLNVFRASEATRSALQSIQGQANFASTGARSEASDVANSPAVRFIDSTLEEAVKIGASDIHIEPNEDNVIVRYRVDGDLFEKSSFDSLFYPSISTRIKILSDIDIAEKRIPQDGHITQYIGGEKYDFRVSTLPTVHGEKFVIRVLDKKIFSLSLKELNFSEEVNRTINKILKHPHGIILLTGPTGSGKTTTLYSFLREVSRPEVNIVTIEDPVEYSMKGINQVQVNNKANLTFASSLRSILRQDPDIIMVGEIRDEETAQIAIRAAITGHIVLSTLHTNDAPGAVNRLIDMGVPSYLVSDSLVAVISQRLLKRLCDRCKRAVKPTPEQRRFLDIKDNNKLIYEKNGCPYCNGTGYRGRMAVHEIMYLNDDVREIIAKGDVSIEEVKLAAIEKAGMVPLVDSAKRYVLNGETTYNDLMGMIVTSDRESTSNKKEKKENNTY